MNWLKITYPFLSIILGYLLGSFLPGYFLPRWFRKADIRNIGDGNPGVINVYRNFGLPLAVPTCVYDLFKSLLPILFFPAVLKLPLSYAYLAGISAVLGHKFPFYLKFKGGRGIASTFGLFFYILVKILIQDFTFHAAILLLGYIILYALLLIPAAHGKGDIFTVTIFPFLGIYMMLNIPVSADLALFLVMVVIMAAEAGKNLARDGFKLCLEDGTSWRLVARLFALLFIPLGLVMPKYSIVILLGCFLALCLVLDLTRMFVPRFENVLQGGNRFHIRINKESERGRLSNISNFLGGLFITFILLDRNIAFACLGFVSLAGFLSEVVHINFGKRKVMPGSDKTLEGSLAFLSGVVTVAFFLWTSGMLPIQVTVVGALAATFTVVLYRHGNGNLAIPIISGALMSLL